MTLQIKIHLFQGYPDHEGYILLNHSDTPEIRADIAYRTKQVQSYIEMFNSLPQVGLRLSSPDGDHITINYVSIDPVKWELYIEMYYE